MYQSYVYTLIYAPFVLFHVYFDSCDSYNYELWLSYEFAQGKYDYATFPCYRYKNKY